MLPVPTNPPWTSLNVTTGDPDTVMISLGLLPHRMQLLRLALAPLMYIPPPSPVAEFPLNVQLITDMLVLE